MDYKDAAEQPVYTETFMVPFKLMGLAIGRDGGNINKSRKIKGVLSVRNKKKPDGYRFTVIGESHKAVNEARCLLEIKQKAYTMPKHLAGRVIGKFGNVIKEVIDKPLVKKTETQNEKENACINKRIQRRYEFNANKKKLLTYGGGGKSFKGKYNVHRRKKPSGSKTPDEDYFVFFLENKMFRRIDYDEKQKQKQRALQKLSRCNLKMQHQDQRKLSKRELAIGLRLHIGDNIHSVTSFTENKQCKDQQKCSKQKMVDAKANIYVIETDHGHINLTKARFFDNCLGKYIEAAIKNKGLNGALKVASWTDCYDDRGTGISLESPEFLNKKKRCKNQQKCSKKKKVKAKVKNKIIETNQRKTNLTKARFQDISRGKYIEAARALKVVTSTDCDEDRGTWISLDSNEKAEISFETCIENESKRENEQFWLCPQQIKDTWEEWVSDDESSISSELELFKNGETEATSNCVSNSLTNQLLAVHDETKTLVAYKVGGIIEVNTSDVEN
ncbi:uncharacterized protein LOC127720274 isoform X1 [Mytilus californianus]|uniref:uncharacterized protein LOC127720274 isoform X1 n=1 Tax=Mytilus californianus TaxID=6549 RepID=UPI002246BB7E|nr:uncharacterized protein LOC127720274 isoform X1 [Mytilus californianus]